MEEGGELQILKSTLAASATYLPPMEMFEPIETPASSLMSAILDRAEPKREDPKHDADRTDYFYWLRHSQADQTGSGKPASYAAFYGSAVDRGIIGPTDIDLLLLSETPAIELGFRRPKAFHIYQLDMRQEPSHLFLARGLLLMAEPARQLLEAIEEAKSKVRSSFESGLFQMMLYAAYKSLMAGESAFQKEEWGIITKFQKPRVERTAHDLGDLTTRLLSTSEFNEKICCGLQSMDEKELKVVTTAAIRRMKVNAAFKEDLASRFSQEVRKPIYRR